MQDKERLIRRTQLRRTAPTATATATATHAAAPPPDDATQPPPKKQGPDLDEDIFDDLDFYEQLLHDFIESTTHDSVFPDGTLPLLPKRQKQKKLTQGSKEKVLRYDVHAKIANFMAPTARPAEWDNPDLFSHVFGGAATAAAKAT
eukprot:TRINITY_DN1244_c0_g1_i2.p1 TRINITY_DN1244_c0_g1~~TRINITY_DN1244_c0_g1_i2.p1  ORF type:complete len:146 (+),score=41.55 TRINITY_DN1244_c0_g1_i2:88-525(+)